MMCNDSPNVDNVEKKTREERGRGYQSWASNFCPLGPDRNQLANAAASDRDIFPTDIKMSNINPFTYAFTKFFFVVNLLNDISFGHSDFNLIFKTMRDMKQKIHYYYYYYYYSQFLEFFIQKKV